MASVIFAYNSDRAVKARLSRHVDPIMPKLLGVLAALLVVCGGVLLAFGETSGWLVVGIAAPIFVVSAWLKNEVLPLPYGTHPDQIDDMLPSEILRLVPRDPSPRDIATAVGGSNLGQFFAVRFGLSSGFLQNIASEDKAHAPEIWQSALAIREELGVSQLSAGVLILALVRAFPSYESLLAQLHLDEKDIVRGIHWQAHIFELISDHSKPKRTGGLARDWSFGYVPLLMRFGQNLSEQIARGGLITVELEAHRDALNQIVSTFTSGGRQNIALVGSAGAGKTTVVQAFAERLLDASSDLSSELKFRQVFLLDASSLISAAPGRGELENLVMRVLGEAYSAKNIIICLDNAQLFFEEGIGSVDLSNVLLPILEAGRLRMILTMEEQRLLQIGQRNPALVNALNRVMIPSASKDETIAVMQDQLIMTEFRQKVTYTYQALEEAYRLGDRYVHDLAMPGKAIKLMETAAGFAESGLVTINSVQQAIEKTMDIKVGVASTTDDREKLLHLEDLIHRRMINQSRAVSVVSDAIRRARAGVRNENRPIGTFLFLGPTGVGKTELSKALADVYFGGENRLVRVDLNEFVRPDDVVRLIADGARDPSSLTAQVMKQPFSVVLLDEIEKAAPEVLTTLLQLLDEGILRDINNRDVSFRDTIVIATSNAGADRIREYIDRGYQMEQFEQQFIDELISSGQFRPEFLNRFDEIALFRPFTKDELLQVAGLIIASVNKTLEPQKVTVTVEPDAVKLLVERGYDPRLGARPMRRVIQKAVENTVAKQMLSGQAGAGSDITISAEQVQQVLGSVVPQLPQTPDTLPPPTE